MVLEDDLVTEHTESDKASVAFIQLVFRARLVKRAVRKLSENVLRAKEPIYTTPELLEILFTPPDEREGAQLDAMLHALHHLPFFQTLSELQQAHCCRCIGGAQHNLNDVVYTSGDLGTTFYIVLAGGCRMEADNGRATLELSVGDSFGHVELMASNRDHTRKTTVTALSGTYLATIERQDYLRLTGELENEVIKILQAPVKERSETELAIVRALFKNTPFFSNLHYEMLQDVCCRNMSIRTANANTHLFHAGEDGAEFFVTIAGTVRVILHGEDERGKNAGYVRDKSKDILLNAGSSFGEIAITSSKPEDWKRSAGIHCVTDCTFAVLSREHYLQSTSVIESQVHGALETDTQQRTSTHIDLLMSYFRAQPFFKGLALEGLRRQACSIMFCEHVEAGTVLWQQGSQDIQTFHILLRGGPVREVKEGETVRKLKTGDEIGADDLTDDTTSRSTTLIADDECVLATFTKEDYLRIFAVWKVIEWVHKFWNLVTIEAFGHKAEDNEHDRVNFVAYAELHKRISKTIHESSYFKPRRETQDAQADWKEDVERAHRGLGGLPCVTLDSLTKSEFSDAMLQLVDVWCEHIEAMDLFIQFLKTVFGSISYFHREQKCFRYKKMGQIRSLYHRLEDIRNVTLIQSRADEQAGNKRRAEMIAKRGSKIGPSISPAKLQAAIRMSRKITGLRGPPNQQDAKTGNQRLCSSKADWKDLGVVSGESVMVKVSAESARGSLPDSAEVWAQGTVIRCASDRVVIEHSGGEKTETLYVNDPDTYSKINGYVVEYAPVGSKDWKPHSPDVSNLIISAANTGSVAKFRWQAHPSTSAMDYEVSGTASPTATPAGLSMNLRLVRLNSKHQPVKAKCKEPDKTSLFDMTKPWRVAARTASALGSVSKAPDTQGDHYDKGTLDLQFFLDKKLSDIPWDRRDKETLELYGLLGEMQVRLAQNHHASELVADTESKLTSTSASHSHNKHALKAATGSPQEYTLAEVKADIKRLRQLGAAFRRCGMLDEMSATLTHLNAHRSLVQNNDMETRELYGLLGEMQVRLAQDHRVPELVADTESKLTSTSASHSHNKHALKAATGSPQEYTLAEVKADIKRLHQRGAAFRRCGMLDEMNATLTHLNAHRNLLQNLWAYVDNMGTKEQAKASQEPKRWYAGSPGRQQRPVTGITERLDKQRSAARSFSVLIPSTPGIVLTPDDPSVDGTINSYSYSMSTTQPYGPGAGAGSNLSWGGSQSRHEGELPQISQGSIQSAVSASNMQGWNPRRPMQLERHEFLPDLERHDRSLARSRKSPYRMRPKRFLSSVGVSKKYAA